MSAQHDLLVSGGDELPRTKAISPEVELGAYEALWEERALWGGKSATFKRIADEFRKRKDCLPSDLVDEATASRYSKWAMDEIHKAEVHNFGVRVHNSLDYPARLRDADHPLELFYYQGSWKDIDRPSIAVVGTREPTPKGKARTRRVVRYLVEQGFVVVSGLARGIDTAAHTAAMEFGGRTIAVLGTPLTEVYPPENQALQAQIAEEHLVISQVPIIMYSRSNPHFNRIFFFERNITMSALTQATIIVEAGDTSGTLVQARHAIKQGRKLLILESCFDRDRALKWPDKMVAKGAIRISGEEQLEGILEKLKISKDKNTETVRGDI